MKSPVDDYLAEQKRLQTPVARFADAERAGAQARYSELIPLSVPGPGEQYAFEVELDACTGCKACVAACGSLNGLDAHETWREVGSIAGVGRQGPFTQAVTTACHHCEDPGCLNGCPVLAYEKDSVTGIVRHLDDQCIGCSYCVLMCPYDVPKYNPRLGIVRKCDLCQGRMAEGEAPACVQACPTQAIRIVTVKTDRTRPPADFLPGAPDPRHTRPTTRYLSSRFNAEDIHPAAAAAIRPEPAHWPLVTMTTLVGMGAGCWTLAAIADGSPLGRRLAFAGSIAGWAGLAASVAHLGQPLRAWRIFLGLRRSWMSREAVLLGLWAVAAPLALRLGHGHAGEEALGVVAAALGVAGLFCSVMIYADTPRPDWAFRRTAPRFFGGAAVLALSAAAMLQGGVPTLLGWAALAVLALKLAGEWPSASRLANGPLRSAVRFRLGVSALGALLGVAGIVHAGPAAPLGIFAFLALLAGEIAERSLFFRGVTAPRMPGVSLP